MTPELRTALASVVSNVGSLLMRADGQLSRWAVEDTIASMTSALEPLVETLQSLNAEELNKLYERNEALEFELRAAKDKLAKQTGLVAFRDLQPFFVMTKLRDGSYVVDGIPTIKAIRELTGVGLKESKQLYDRWTAQFRKPDGSINDDTGTFINRYDSAEDAVRDNPFLQ